MKLSKTGMGTTKLNNIDEMYPGQSILLQTGQLVQYGAGLFAYNTVPLLVKRNVEKIITETLNKYNLDFAVTGGKFISFKDRNYLIQIEIVKKTKEPSNLGKVRIDGEWI